mmetsp:Transcript_13454/g.30506  ORF Transcript_13454/g.30506 Transcript_13454/m.30506 type:complete len:109 (+) Transcript_13454:1490-1816(+)
MAANTDEKMQVMSGDSLSLPPRCIKRNQRTRSIASRLRERRREQAPPRDLSKHRNSLHHDCAQGSVVELVEAILFSPFRDFLVVSKEHQIVGELVTCDRHLTNPSFDN